MVRDEEAGTGEGLKSEWGLKKLVPEAAGAVLLVNKVCLGVGGLRVRARSA